ncbi:MAG: restriction endonuclease subunit S [Kineosporiaceae bacterium]
MSEDQARALGCTYLNQGDILVARMPEPIARACLVPRGIGSAVTAVDVAVIRLAREDVDPRFLMWWFNSPVGHGLAASLQSGTTRKRISRKNLATLSVPVPPMFEQRRIVDILEDHLSRLDAAGSLIGAARRRTEMLALSLKARFVAEQRSSAQAHRLGELCTIGSGATPRRGNTAYWESGVVPWVTSGDLSDGIITQASRFVTELALHETSIRLWPKGTLLVAMYGEGKTRGTVAELGISATCNQACAALSLKGADQIERSWLRLVLESSYEEMRRASSGGVQPNLSLGYFRELVVPWPTRERMRNAVEEVGAADAATIRLRNSLTSAERHGESLRRALLSAAFSGRLTGGSSDLDLAEELAAQ